MKNILAVLVLLSAFVSCNQSSSLDGNKGDTAFAKSSVRDSRPEGEQSGKAKTQQTPYQSYGAKITPDGTSKVTQIQEKYASLKEGDTALVKFEAPINAVCKSKGCWMRLDAGEEEVFVKFKGYGFFVPLDANGEAIVEGKAYIEEVSVNELRHMAQDAGKSQDEIAAITVPKREYRFMADGVLIKGN